MNAKSTPFFLFALFVALVPAGLCPGQGFATGPVAAVVNGDKIYVSEVQQLLKKDTPQVHPLTQKQKAELWEMALNMLINDMLMKQFLAKNTAQVPPAEVEKELKTLKEALEKQQPKVTYAQFLKDSNQTEEQLREEIMIRIQWRAYVTARMPEDLIKKYYDANKIFFDKVFVKASHILVRFPEKATAAEKQQAADKLKKIRQDIVAGKITFENAAKQFSECPSKTKGGDIGHFPYKFVVAEPFAHASFGMKVGDMSDLVETEFGYHIIKVTERTPAQPSNFNEMKDVIRDVYAQDLQLFQTIISEQREKAKIEVMAPGL